MTFLRLLAVVAVLSVLVTEAAYAQVPPAPVQGERESSSAVTVPLDMMPSSPNAKTKSDLSKVQGKILAGEAYVEADLKELLQTFVMLDGVNIKDPEILGHYASIFYCPLFKEKFENDFEWNTLREQISSRLLLKKEHYRSLYEVTGVVYLGRYNFDTQDFPLAGESRMFNVGSMVMVQGRYPNNCKIERRVAIVLFPMIYMLYLKQPFTLDRLKISMDEAEALLKRMELEKNAERKLFIRFRSKIQSLYAGKMVDTSVTAGFLGELTAVDIFFDREMTQLVTSIPID